MVQSETAYKEDYKYATQLLSGDAVAWDRLYSEFRRKLEAYINRRYPGVFGSIAIEEIFDGVGKRLIENDFKVLREYRGECSFSTYVTRATEWEIKDWLRKHSEELMSESVDTIGNDDKVSKGREAGHASLQIEEQEDIPDAIKSLSDDLRFAFLLRYYDFFGFPLDEIRLLAKKKGVTIGSITEKIVRLLDPAGEDVLGSQREKQQVFRQRLQKVCYEIHKLTVKEHRLAESDARSADDETGSRRSSLEKKRDILMKDGSKFVITTPYEVIVEILGENNVSTIRSRVFLAKKELTKKFMVKKTKTFSGNISS
jgi:RNA polymerase sigma factor (sigma-70 family)